jgi:hypothetical protein
MRVAEIVALRVLLQKSFVPGDRAVCVAEILVAMPDVIESLFALFRPRKLVVSALVPFRRFDEIVIEEIAAADLKQRLGALRALREIVDQGQVVSPRVGEAAVELVNAGAAQRLGFGQRVPRGRVNPIKPRACPQRGVVQ